MTECDVDTRKKLYASIVPSGGTAMMDSGDGVLHTVPNEGYALPHTILRLIWLAVILQSV